MELLLPIFLLIFIIWLVSQSRGIKYHKYSKASSTTTIDLRSRKSIIYNGKNILKSPTTYKFDNRTACYRIINTESKISNPTFHIDEPARKLLLFNSRNVLNDSVRSKNFKPHTTLESLSLDDIISIELLEKNEKVSFSQYLIDAGIEKGKIAIFHNNENTLKLDKLINQLKKSATKIHHS